MNTQQAQSTLESSKQIETINFDEFVSRIYPDRTDLDNIELTQMNLAEFIYLSKRVFDQFISEFSKRDNTLILPYYYNHPHFGNGQVDGVIQNYILQINSNNIKQAENALLWLVSYQVTHNFYYKPIKKTGETISSNISRLSEKLNLIQKNISNKQREIENQYSQLETTKTDIQNFITQKKEELKQITTNLSTSNTNTSQINDLLTKGTEQSSRLNTLLEQQEQNKTNADKKLKKLQELFELTNTILDEHVKTILTQLEEFKKQNEINEGHLKFIESKREFFDERIKYLEDLIGREVGASLFETFKQRKNELTKPVKFWRWAVPVMSLLTVAWIFFLFQRQQGITDTSLWWETFAVNSLKTIPAIFLLLFSINQYRKERNFQEEYAFKSAVALTIKAYANQLKDTKNSDTLIMEAVLNVYKTPIEERHTGKIKSKKILETVKTVAETTRDLVKGAK